MWERAANRVLMWERAANRFLMYETCITDICLQVRTGTSVTYLSHSQHAVRFRSADWCGRLRKAVPYTTCLSHSWKYFLPARSM
jgi:hypothetical protein